jgi:hypothetical protein
VPGAMVGMLGDCKPIASIRVRFTELLLPAMTGAWVHPNPAVH